MYTENTIIATVNKNKIVQAVPLKDKVANKPTRAERAVANINIKIGVATIKPIRHAKVLIFATMICICRAINLSVAPT